MDDKQNIETVQDTALIVSETAPRDPRPIGEVLTSVEERLTKLEARQEAFIDRVFGQGNF